ncbi:MAG TPA: SRPBCC domain-containing protein [Terriglobales bacterium]|nr:SRPBCC domain-containing protein [Terriglobales bacterium]
MIETKKNITIDAPPAVVFKALTDESELVQWMFQEAKMDARVGGEYEFKFNWPAAKVTSVGKGRIRELIPNKKLSYTFDADYPGTNRSVKDTIVTWTLEELPGDKTRVTLVHVGVDWAGYSYWLEKLASHCRDMISKTS